MPPRPFKQASFAAGVISPELYGRLDVERVAVGLRTCTNFVVGVTGAVKNRQGSGWVRSAKTFGATRLIPFIFSEDQAYALEFGAGYIRFIRSGAAVVDPGGVHEGGTHATIFSDLKRSWVTDTLIGAILTNETDGSTGTITSNTNNTVTCSAGLAGTGSNDFENGDAVSIAAPYEIAAPWAAADIEKLKYTQANDVVTLTHYNQEYAPYELRRYADDNWTLTTLVVVRPVNPPDTLALTNAWDVADTTHPDKQLEWVATGVDANGIESLGSDPLLQTDATLYADRTRGQFSLVAPTTGNVPVRFNWYRGNDGVYGWVGSSRNLTFVDEGYEPDIFDTPPQAFNPFVKTVTPSEAAGGGWVTLEPVGGTAFKTSVVEALDDLYYFTFVVTLYVGNPWGSQDVSIQFNIESRPTPGPGTWTIHKSYDIRKNWRGGVVGLSYDLSLDGAVADHEFRINVTGFTAAWGGQPNHSAVLTNVSYLDTPAGYSGGEEVDYPACAGYFQQRQFFANFLYNRQRLVGTRTGDFNNFDRSLPTRDDDSIDLTIASGTLDEIRSLVHMESFWVFTPGGVWRMSGIDGDKLTPSSFDLKKTVRYGASWLTPVQVGPTALFQTERGRKVRELIDTPEDQGARDLSALAPHLLRKQKIIEWGYAEDPDSVVWCVREDGALLGLTYSVEHDIWAWHEHTTDGTYESVCVIPEGNIDTVYAIIKRTINGTPVQYIERFAERWTEEDDIEDAVFLDSAIAYDGRHTGAVTVQITAGTTWAADEVMRITAFPNAFVAGDVGDRIHIRLNGSEYRFHITNYIGTDEVDARLVAGTVAVGDRGPAVGSLSDDWGFARLAFTGADHLEAETLSALVDGNVETGLTVTSGVLTLDNHAERVTLGIPYNADLSPLLSAHGRGSYRRDEKKLIAKVGIEVDQWRGLQVGEDSTNLRDVQQRDVTDDYDTVQLGNELISFKPKTGWKRTPTILIRQNAPLPVTVVGIIPTMSRERER